METKKNYISTMSPELMNDTAHARQINHWWGTSDLWKEDIIKIWIQYKGAENVCWCIYYSTMIYQLKTESKNLL